MSVNPFSTLPVASNSPSLTPQELARRAVASHANLARTHAPIISPPALNFYELSLSQMWGIYRSVVQIFERPQPAPEARVPLLALAAPTSPKAITAAVSTASSPLRGPFIKPPPPSSKAAPASAPVPPLSSRLIASPPLRGPFIRPPVAKPSPQASSASTPPPPSPLTASPPFCGPFIRPPTATPSPKASPASTSPSYFSHTSPAAIPSVLLSEVSQSNFLAHLLSKSQVPITPFSSHRTSPSSSPASNLSPNERWVEMINREFAAIADGVTERFDGTLNIKPDDPNEMVFTELEKNGCPVARMEETMRKKWQDQIQLSSDLIRKAAAEMLALFADLEKATQHIQKRDARYAQMAHLLMNDPIYSMRFYPTNRKTLFSIYRFIRGMIYIVHCPKLDHPVSPSKKIHFWMVLTQKDVTHYGVKGTEEYEMRTNHNEVVETFAPLRRYLTGEVVNLLTPDNGTLNFEIFPPNIQRRPGSATS